MGVSVIIPTYNCATYLLDAIRSVLNQTEGIDELIVVDDGSTDETVSVIEPVRAQITYLRQQNHGVAAARNVGLARAQGEYIAFLDADDAWFPHKLAVQLAVLRSRPELQAVCSEFSLADERGAILQERYCKGKYRVFQAYGLDWDRMFSQRLRVPLFRESGPPAEADVYFGDAFPSLFLGNFVNTSSMVVRREAIESVGTFTPARRTQEDYEYWLKVALLGPLAYVDHPLLLFRRRPLQLTAPDQKRRIAEDTLHVMEGMIGAGRDRVGADMALRRLGDRYRALAVAHLAAHDTVAARQVLRRGRARGVSGPAVWPLFIWSLLPPRVADALRLSLRRLPG